MSSRASGGAWASGSGSWAGSFRPLADRLGGTEVDDESENLHLKAAERAQQRVDLVDPANQLCPAEAGWWPVTVRSVDLCGVSLSGF